jgi:hypothetical protein
VPEGRDGAEHWAQSKVCQRGAQCDSLECGEGCWSGHRGMQTFVFASKLSALAPGKGGDGMARA